MNFVLILDAAKCNCNEVFTAVSYFCHQKTKKKPDFGYCSEVKKYFFEKTDKK